MQTTACPLDCFDACEVKVENGIAKGSHSNKITNGKLCKLFAYLQNETTIKEQYPLQNALQLLKEKLQNTDPSKVLYYKGSGNMGVMQSAPKHFFSQYGATLTHGGLCDAAGEHGIEQNRGACVNPPIENLINSDIVIVWGRNLTVTSPHIYRLIEEKEFITIDPVKTEIAKKSLLHIQLKPKTDHLLAIMLARFADLEGLDDKEFIKENSDNYEWFYELTRDVRIKKSLRAIGTDLGQLGELFSLLVGKKVAILTGIGPQKYYEGEQIIRCIDAFAATLGLFNKDAGGMWYFGNSMYPFEKPFISKPKAKTASMCELDFGDYDICFIQGANPVVSNPNTTRVIEGLKKSFVVFFGTTQNETAQYADLIIPAKNFMQKKDVRLSYGHDEVVICDQIEQGKAEAISEYDLTQFLLESFEMELLKSEDEICQSFQTKVREKPVVEEFEFIEELDVATLHKTPEQFYLLTSKFKDSLCSQFKTNQAIHMHSNAGFTQGQQVKATSTTGEAIFEVNINDDIREDCVVLYSGSKANMLINHKGSLDTQSATYQETVLSIVAVD